MQSSENISWFADITLNDRSAVGGKGGSLGELTRAGIAVPPGFVVCTTGFEHFLAKLEMEEPIRPRVESLRDGDLEEITAFSERVRARFENAVLPQNLQSRIIEAHAELCGEQLGLPLAVRSSATDRGCGRRQLRRPAGHFSVGYGRAGNFEICAILLVESLLCSLHRLSPQTQNARKWSGDGRRRAAHG